MTIPDDGRPTHSSVPSASRSESLPRLARTRLVIAGIISVLALVLAGMHLFPGRTGKIFIYDWFLYPFFALHIVLLSVGGFALIASFAFRGTRGKREIVISALAIVAVLASGGIAGSITAAAISNGGTINPLTALVPVGSADADGTATYVTADGQDLKALVYKPTGSLADAPVLVYVHGGGWISGSATESPYGQTSRWYADQGWLVVNINYRLATETYATWDKAPADVGCALAWTVALAQELGADSEQFVVAGDSAGGNLALTVGWAAASGEAESTCPDLGPVPTPDAVIAGYPVGNPQYTYENPGIFIGNSDAGDVHTFTNWYLGGTPTDYPERLAAISPASYISPDAPPTLIVQPEGDDYIPAEGNYLLAREAEAGGMSVDVIKIPFTSHAFDGLPYSLGGQTKLTIVEHWLSELGLAPTT